jgi:conjugative relaxase-like TrwC/TraI family protein
MTSKCRCSGSKAKTGRERRFSAWCVRFVSASVEWCGVLSIGKLGTSTGQLEYYERQVAAGAEDYYAGRGEVPGVWLGAGAGALGLELGGRVSRDAFMALMSGAHPVDGSLLRRMTDRSKVAAIDLTFSAPKSVSVLFALAGGAVSDALADAHERAVSAAVKYLEAEACATRRGHAGVERVRGEGFVAAAYRHRLSRAGDPQLHTHVVVANLTWADGRFTALDARPLFEHKSAAGAVYRAVLRAEVRARLPWVSWSKVARGLFEIDGIPAGVLRHFSQRRVEIERRAAELVGAGGVLSRAAMQTIALSTRRAKSEPEGEVWREDARARAAEHGLGPGELQALLAQPAAPAQRPRYREVVARLSGPEGLTGNHNTFARRHALAELAGEFTDGLAHADLERATTGYLADPSVRTLASREDGSAMYSTASLLACERAIIDTATRPGSKPVATVAAQVVDEVLAGTVLNVDQATAVRRLATDRQAVQTVQALAGTGKTTMLRALADTYTRAGYRVIASAPTARAARELRETAGVGAGTLHALAGRMDRGGPPLGDVLLLDEAGMAATRVTARVFAHAERTGMKIIAVGDGGQLASVEAGGWFAALSRDLPGPALREVVRQRDPAERAALAALHDGDAETYLEHKASAITIHASEPDALAAATERWASLRDEHSPSGVVMIARDNATRDQLNRTARARLLADGQLPAEQTFIGGREWAVGDRVIARHNDRHLDIDNGNLAAITAFLPNGAGLEITTDAGQMRTLDAAYVTEHLQHAYAITGHSSQGMTVEAAIVVARPEEFTREWAYTALSRARDETTLELIASDRVEDTERGEYAPLESTREPADALDSLARAMHRRESEPLASERTGRAALTHPAPQHPLSRRSVPPRAPGWASREAGLRGYRPPAAPDRAVGR